MIERNSTKGNRTDSVTDSGTNVVLCLHGNFQPSRPGWNPIVCGCRSFVDSCNFTNKANPPAPRAEIHATQKLCHFGCYVAKGEAGVIVKENFQRSRSQKPRSR